MKAEDVLPDETDHLQLGALQLRKGSVGAFIANARLLADPGIDTEQRRQARTDLLELVPALRALGLFEVFEVRDPRLRALVEVQR